MSYKWTSDAVERISAACMTEVKELMKTLPWLISYDNAQISFRVFSQRLENQSELGQGTAATVYIKPGAEPLPEGINEELKRTRNAGIKNPITERDIFRLEIKDHQNLTISLYIQIFAHLKYQAAP